MFFIFWFGRVYDLEVVGDRGFFRWFFYFIVGNVISFGDKD